MEVTYYREDIDLLRALAVLIVVVFHIDKNWLPGGYVGVDVFFVISGYLITNLLRKELNLQGSINFSKFYMKRARRLVPSLLCTVLISSILAVMLFSSEHLYRYSKAALMAPLSLSNIFFWSESGYFDASSNIKPLLHTWSLSIEEQFYLFWPVVLLFAFKIGGYKGFKCCVSVVTILSFLLNFELLHAFVKSKLNTLLLDQPIDFVQAIYNDPKNALFFLLPFRVFEFGLGALTLFARDIRVKSQLTKILLCMLGVVLIVGASVFYDESYIFPGLAALVPCFGAMLFLLFGDSVDYPGYIISDLSIKGIGKISYSLYLVHWPLIVFLSYYTNAALSFYEKMLILFGCFLLGLLQYKFVEVKYRVTATSVNNTPFLAKGFLLPIAGIVVISIAAYITKGLPVRVENQNFQLPGYALKEGMPKLKNNLKWVKAYRIGELSSAEKILVIGDSHAGHLAYGFKYLSKKYNLEVIFYTFEGCPPIFGTYKIYGFPFAINSPSPKQIECMEQTKRWENYIKENSFDYVVLGSRWNWLFEDIEYGQYFMNRRDILVSKDTPEFSKRASRETFVNNLNYTIRTIRDTGAGVIVFGQVPNTGSDVSNCRLVPSFLYTKKIMDRRCAPVDISFAIHRTKFSNSIISRYSDPTKGVFTVLPSSYFCALSDHCASHKNGISLMRDTDHLSNYGSLILTQMWENDPYFPFDVN